MNIFARKKPEAETAASTAVSVAAPAAPAAKPAFVPAAYPLGISKSPSGKAPAFIPASYPLGISPKPGAAAKPAPADKAAASEEPELTDGFHLVIDALKLNGIDTIYGVPGIPITDLGRMAQAEGIRVHRRSATSRTPAYAAAIAGFLTKKPGVCLTVSAPGFLNGLTALAHATTNCFPMILISGSSEREIVDLQQGDYEEMDQLAIAKPLCKAAFRVLHAADIGIGARARHSRRRLRPSGRRLSRPAGQAFRPGDGCGGRREVAGEGDRCRAWPRSPPRRPSSARSTC